MAWLLVVTDVSALNKSRSIQSAKTELQTCRLPYHVKRSTISQAFQKFFSPAWREVSEQTTGLDSVIWEKPHYQRVFKQERGIKHQELHLVPKLSDTPSQTTASLH